MEMYLQDLQQPYIDEDAIVDHPTTMTNLHHDGLCVDTFTYLLRDDTAPSGDVTAVLTAVGAGHPMGLHHAHKHEFLYQFLPYPMRKQLYHGKSYPFTGVNVPKLTDAELGEVIVGICRHLITHGRDKDVRTLVQKNLNISSYTDDQLTELLRTVYWDLIRLVYKKLLSSKPANDWMKLRARERNPIPSIYQAPGPATNFCYLWELLR